MLSTQAIIHSSVEQTLKSILNKNNPYFIILKTICLIMQENVGEFKCFEWFKLDDSIRFRNGSICIRSFGSDPGEGSAHHLYYCLRKFTWARTNHNHLLRHLSNKIVLE